MSAIGREGGHSRGRTRQAPSGSSGGGDMERNSYIGHASDRGSFGEAERGTSSSASRNESSGGESRSSNQNQNRGSF
jgi:hypothetical protein